MVLLFFLSEINLCILNLKLMHDCKSVMLLFFSMLLKGLTPRKSPPNGTSKGCDATYVTELFLVLILFFSYLPLYNSKSE